jgi:hypothetical protein
MGLRASVVSVALVSAGCASSAVPPSRPWSGPEEQKIEKSNFFVDLALGAGNYEHDTKGDAGGASGDTDGGYLLLRTEYLADMGIGGGLALEGSASDDDLMENAGSLDTEGGMGDLFLYFAAVPAETDEFRLPIRVGPYVHSTILSEDSTDTDITWGALGVRLEATPELWFLRRRSFAIGLVGGASAGIHVTRSELEVGSASEEFDGDGLTLGAELGIQALFANHVSTRIGYVFRTTHESESDDSNGLALREMDATFSGLALQLGVRF